MKLLFVSNFMNHHQLPLCDEFVKLFDEFHFLATMPTPAANIASGYEDMNKMRDYILRSYDGSSSDELIMSQVVDSDVVIFGCNSDAYINTRFRLSGDKPTFFAMERPLKYGYITRFIPRIYRKWQRRIINHKDKSVYVLSASAYAPYDLSLLGFPSGTRCYKWGYFPAVEKTDINSLMSQKNPGGREIMYCGRLIGLKRLQDLITVLARLDKDGQDFHLTVVGSGKSRLRYEKQTERLGIKSKVSFVGSVSHNNTKQYMDRANIAVFPSSFQEGWGAVLNEFMGSACAIVASHSAGSVPYLLRHNKNALVYKYGDLDSLYSLIARLLGDNKLIKKLGLSAYDSIFIEWSPKVAAKQFYMLVKAPGLEPISGDGPCSKAGLIKNNDSVK